MYHFAARVALPLMAALLCAMPIDDARAQASRGSSAKLDLEKITADLQSGEERRILSALARIASAGADGVPAAPHVNALLRRGATPAALERALGVAGGLGQAASSAPIAPYVRHRSPALRHAAAQALTRTGGSEAIAALRSGLRVRDPEVRAISARGLGELGAREAVDDLLRALSHQVVEAARSIGQLCAPAQCDKLTAQLGQQPLAPMLQGMDHLLLRPASEVPDEQKLRAIEQLLKLGTAEVGKFLASVSRRWPKGESPEVKEELDEAAEMLGADPGKS